MAAVILPQDLPHNRPRPVRPGSDRPELRLIPGGRSPRVARRLHPGAYRRRRVGAAIVLVALVVVLWLAVLGLQSLVHHRATAGPSAPQPVVAAGAAEAPAPQGYYVVRPGDTMWSIARRLRPSGDVRALVDALAERNGGPGLQVGQRVSLDGLDL